jgi:hypothetical protein
MVQTVHTLQLQKTHERKGKRKGEKRERRGRKGKEGKKENRKGKERKQIVKGKNKRSTCTSWGSNLKGNE